MLSIAAFLPTLGIDPAPLPSVKAVPICILCGILRISEAAYVKTYLREEVFQESLVRNLQLFTSFMEVASFSQGETINYTEIAREVGSNRNTITMFFDILEDLLIAYRIPIHLIEAMFHPIFGP